MNVLPGGPDVKPDDLRTGHVSDPVSSTDLDDLDDAARPS
jgi:hypothetical protein